MSHPFFRVAISMAAVIADVYVVYLLVVNPYTFPTFSVFVAVLLSLTALAVR